MDDDRVPTIVYAGASAVLGLVTFIAALIWHSDTTSSNSPAVNGSSSISNAPAGIISGVLVLLGAALIVWSILFFLVRTFRKKTVHEGEIPNRILQKKPDKSLRQPLPQAEAQSIEQNEQIK